MADITEPFVFISFLSAGLVATFSALLVAMARRRKSFDSDDIYRQTRGVALNFLVASGGLFCLCILTNLQSAMELLGIA